MIQTFLAEARARYEAANAGTLEWMLARPMRGGLLNTKLNAITLKDYGPEDGVRGPDFAYGWIQGRGLESLVGHAAYFEGSALGAKLDAAGRELYGVLDALRARYGHAYFCYDAAMSPVFPDADYVPRKQAQPPHIFSYSDAFFAKGLVAASARYAQSDLPRQRKAFAEVISAIEDGRFQIDERKVLEDAAVATQPDDFGPRMILLGAAGTLQRAGFGADAAFADRFVAHLLDRHFDAKTGLVRNVPGEDACNVGHGIEFVGFALDYLSPDADPKLIATLERILIASFRAGFVGRGITLSVSIATGQPLSPNCPWWSLPETIRAAALCYERTGNAELIDIWQAADTAFFESYWRGTPAVAYQTITKAGPLDFVPATPDLDPGYHTGLSLLSAIGVAERGSS